MAEIGIKKAAFYNAIAKYGSMVFQLGLTMVLSRIIAPEAFGVIAITTVLLGFLNLFADMGLGISIVQHPDIKRNDINRLFSFSIVIGIILGAVTALAAFPLAAIYEEPLYKVLCPVLSFVSFFQAVNVVPNAIMMRDKQFKVIAIRTILCTAVSGIVAVILALMGLGVYALIIQSIISQVFLFTWNFIYAPLSITPFSFREVNRLLGSYSLYQVLFNFLNYFTRNLDNLVIGKHFGSAPLAQYNKSYYLYLYPNTIFASVITGVLHPYIRDYKNDNKKMFTKYVQIEKFLSLIGIYTMMTFFTCSDEIVRILFGNNWGPAGLYLRCLSLCMWTQMMGSVSGSIFLGLERTDQIFKCGLINLTLLIISICCGVLLNSVAILSLCVAISYNLIFVITNIILVRQTMHLRIRDFFSRLFWDGVFVFLFVLVIYFVPSFSQNIFISLLIKLFICTIAYSLYMTITNQWGVLLAVRYVKEK